MKFSDVIALVVAAFLVGCCSFLFLSIVIRGRLGTSGYRIDWGTSPISMTIWLISLVICPVIIVWGFATNWHSDSRDHAESFRIYLETQPNIRPRFHYEGPGVQRALRITGDHSMGFQFSFSAMCLPDGVPWELDGVNDRLEYRVFDFTGNLSCSNGKCLLHGGLHSREPGELFILESKEKISLHPGKNVVTAEWDQQ